MKVKKLIAHSICIVALFIGIDTFAQTNKTVEIKSTAVAKFRGSNPKIKVDMPTNDSKPIVKARGSGCTIQFENYTGLYIKVYVNGYYKGTMDAWGKAKVVTNNGYETVYLVSVGGTREWNTSGDCSGVYTFVLK
ncbi:hypothetical protein GM921_03900 [Pedobacter sp. LMG 31464]|uniref:Uncharacterized protein n=1 Tax=Pedobacter planticolens TaxID=2679964 RepID=A0A923IUX4_9SPHI|nr:hypothetical protein [Pedobacter planticolens]MBB2144614.1 hypothetical protein [Pedobacter planticolens]